MNHRINETNKTENNKQTKQTTTATKTKTTKQPSLSKNHYTMFMNFCSHRQGEDPHMFIVPTSYIEWV